MPDMDPATPPQTSVFRLLGRIAAGGDVDDILAAAGEAMAVSAGATHAVVFWRTGGELVGSDTLEGFGETAVEDRTAIIRSLHRAIDDGVITRITPDSADGAASSSPPIVTVPTGRSTAVVLRDVDPDKLSDRRLKLLEMIGSVTASALSKPKWAAVEPGPGPPTVASATMIIDGAGRVHHVTRALADALDLDATEITGRPVDELPITEAKELETAANETLDSGSIDSIQVTFEVQTEDAERVRFIGAVEPLEPVGADERQSAVVTGTVGPPRDPTTGSWFGDRPFKKLVEHFPNGMVTLFDEAFRFRLAGGELFDMIDLNRADVIGQRLDTVFPPENVSTLEPIFVGVFDGESGQATVEYGDRVFLVRTVPVYDDTGTVRAGMSMSQDITERKRRESLLERAREKYRTLVEAAPDAIFLGRVATGELVEMNEAAERLIGRDAEDVLGGHQTALHPPADADRYMAEFERHAAAGGMKSRYLGDSGDQLFVKTATGDHVPVEIHTATVTIEGEELMFGIFRDITDHVRYERTLTELHAATRDLLEAESRIEIGRIVVDAATEILDLSLVSVNTYDESIGALKPIAYSPDVEELLENTRALSLEDSIAGRAFLEGETTVIDDVRTDPDVHNPDTIVRSQMIVPIGEYGVFICGDTESGRFAPADAELAEVLTRTAETAFNRTDREQALRRREVELEQKTEFLETLESINTAIRRVTSIAIAAETRAEVEESVCSALVEDGDFTFAWIGELDPVGNAVIPRATAGSGGGYLEAIPLNVDAGADEPAVRAASADAITEVKNIAIDPQETQWRRAGLTRGFHSALALPITYKDMSYGVLGIYAPEPDAYSGIIRSVLGELADITAYALNAVERKHALVTHQTTKLVLDITSADCYFLRLARATGCSLAFDGLLPHEDSESSVFVRVTDGPVREFESFCSGSRVVDSHRQLTETGDEPLYQIRFSGQFIASLLANYGIILQSITADDDAARIRVGVSPTFSLHRATEIVMSEYSAVEFVAKEVSDEPIDRSLRFPERYLDTLTDRQEEAIQLAYLSGYYETPKQVTGSDLASMMDISSTAFHNHLRLAEQKLVAAVFEDRHNFGTDVE